MKVFFEARIPLPQKEHADVLIARLAGLGFDGFVEEDDHLLAYIEKKDESPEDLSGMLMAEGISDHKVAEIADQNWNAMWEAQYEAVVIEDKVMVRAPFHEPLQGIAYDIVIEPRMSFGTAHHETTSMMLSFILQMDCAGKDVLDMGCGTAVLAILAKMKGARNTVAIDNDEWAFNNALDNVGLNRAADILVMLGDAGSIGERKFDIVLANINRNILLEDIPAYAASLKAGGLLLVSGFYGEDLELIREKCLSSGLAFDRHMSRNRWTAALFNKK